MRSKLRLAQKQNTETMSDTENSKGSGSGSDEETTRKPKIAKKQKKEKEKKKRSARSSRSETVPTKTTKVLIATVTTNNQLLLAFRQLYYENASSKKELVKAKDIPDTPEFKLTRNLMIQNDPYLKLYDYFTFITEIQAHSTALFQNITLPEICDRQKHISQSIPCVSIQTG